MPRSDARSDPNSDVLVREVVRQIADAAPPPPDWSSLRRPERARAHHDRLPWGQSALVAAVIAMLVSGLWLLARPSDAPETPADVPTTATLRAPLPVTWDEWVRTATPIDVQWCLTRVMSNRSVDAEAELLTSISPDQTSMTRAQRLQALHLPSQRVLSALSALSDSSPELAASAQPVVAAFDRFSGNIFGDDGLVSPDAAVYADEFLAARGSSDALAPDPTACWLETPAGALVLDAAVRGTGEIEVVRCLALAQFDQLARPEPGWGDANAFPLTVASARSLASWYAPTPSQLVELVRAVSDLEFVNADARSEQLAAIRASLDLDALAARACPLLDPDANRIDARESAVPTTTRKDGP